MNFSISHRLRKIARNAPGLFWGYNIYVDTHKLRLIDHVYESCLPGAASFADLGGVWKVNAAFPHRSKRSCQGFPVFASSAAILHSRTSSKRWGPSMLPISSTYCCTRQILRGIKCWRPIPLRRRVLLSTTSNISKVRHPYDLQICLLSSTWL